MQGGAVGVLSAGFVDEDAGIVYTQFLCMRYLPCLVLVFGGSSRVEEPHRRRLVSYSPNNLVAIIYWDV